MILASIFVLLFLNCLTLAQKCGISPSLERYAKYDPNRIAIGEFSEIGDWPWIVFILGLEADGGQGACTGSIIDNQWILTAAIFYGNVKIAQTTRSVEASEVYLHPQYIHGKVTNDIALIKLVHPLDFDNTTSSICLNQTIEVSPEEVLVSAGFGVSMKQIFIPHSDELINLDDPSQIELEDRMILAETPIALRAICPAPSSTNMTDIICVGGVNTGPMRGDSGGPLMVIRDNQWFQVGIASAVATVSVDQLSIESLALYSKIEKHCDWIEKTTNKDVNCMSEAVSKT